MLMTHTSGSKRLTEEKALDWARAQNKVSDEALAPHFRSSRSCATGSVEVFNDKDRIIYPDIVGEMSYNLWQDQKNEKRSVEEDAEGRITLQAETTGRRCLTSIFSRRRRAGNGYSMAGQLARTGQPVLSASAL